MPNNKKPRVAWCVRSAVLMTVSLLFPSTSLHAAQSLTLLTWEEYLSEAVIERWQAETGTDAILDGDGRTFAEVTVERLGDVDEGQEDAA